MGGASRRILKELDGSFQVLSHIWSRIVVLLNVNSLARVGKDASFSKHWNGQTNWSLNHWRRHHHGVRAIVLIKSDWLRWATIHHSPIDRLLLWYLHSKHPHHHVLHSSEHHVRLTTHHIIALIIAWSITHEVTLHLVHWVHELLLFFPHHKSLVVVLLFHLWGLSELIRAMSIGALISVWAALPTIKELALKCLELGSTSVTIVVRLLIVVSLIPLVSIIEWSVWLWKLRWPSLMIPRTSSYCDGFIARFNRLCTFWLVLILYLGATTSRSSWETISVSILVLTTCKLLLRIACISTIGLLLWSSKLALALTIVCLLDVKDLFVCQSDLLVRNRLQKEISIPLLHHHFRHLKSDAQLLTSDIFLSSWSPWAKWHFSPKSQRPCISKCLHLCVLYFSFTAEEFISLYYTIEIH